MPEQPEAGAVSRLTEWVSDVEAGHDTVGADPLTTAILRRRAADTLTILADLARMKAALEKIEHEAHPINGMLRGQLYAIEEIARLALRQHEDGK